MNTADLSDLVRLWLCWFSANTSNRSIFFVCCCVACMVCICYTSVRDYLKLFCLSYLWAGIGIVDRSMGVVYLCVKMLSS